MTVLLVLTAARRRGVVLSALSAGLPGRHTASDRPKEIDTSASQLLLARIEDDRQALRALLGPDAGTVQSIDRTDGLRVTCANGAIVHLRPSSNAPELRCYAEAATVGEAERLCGECLEQVGRELA